MVDLVNRKRAAETSPRRKMKSRGLRTNAWWTLRNRKMATIDDLLFKHADGSQKDAESNLRKYLTALVRAGILIVDAKRQAGNKPTSNGNLVYRLAIDCGQEAPVYRVRLAQVYCPDTGDIYPLADKVPPPKAVSPKGGTA